MILRQAYSDPFPSSLQLGTAQPLNVGYSLEWSASSLGNHDAAKITPPTPSPGPHSITTF